MSGTVISVAKQFSKTPAGRFYTDGPYSGEAFREKLLFPALSEQESVEVDLDGAFGLGSSFLEEAFGGLIRERGMSMHEIKKKLSIKSRRKFYIDKIWRYMEDAAEEALAKKR